MPDTREKLIEIYNKLEEEGLACTAGKAAMADLMIANGVTVQKVDGCEYCRQCNDPWDAPMIAKEDYEPDRGIYLYNGFLCANGGEFVDAKVNFCPMCGRKLPEPPKGE